MEMSKEQLQKDLVRKIKCRKFALESYDLHNFIDEDNPLSKKENYRELQSNLVDAKELAFQDGYFALLARKGFFGKVEVFYKKAVRKLLKIFYGWYIFPIYKRQTEYNEVTVENIRILKELLEDQQEEIAFLREEIERLKENQRN